MQTSSDSDSTFKTPQRGRVRQLVSPPTPLSIPASPFMKKLGCGTGVSVYLMTRKGAGQSPWAVKKMNSRCASQGQAAVYQERLVEEALTLQGLTHPNIIGFRAFATATDGSRCLAMEYGGERSLNDLIEARREAGLGAFPAPTIHRVALDLARGLQYLHNEKHLLHGDMKSCNVVVKGDFTSVKICDVGVALKLDHSMKVSDPQAQYVGTEPWSPREALDGGEITDKADIFAYGLTLWEMMSLSIPHLEDLDEEGEEEGEDGSDEEDVDFDEDAYYERLGSRPPLDRTVGGGAYQRVVELFSLCTEEDPKLRPSANQIVQALEADAHPVAAGNDEHDIIVID